MEALHLVMVFVIFVTGQTRLTKFTQVGRCIEPEVLHVLSLELPVLGDEHLVLLLVQLVAPFASCNLHHLANVILHELHLGLKEKKYFHQVRVNLSFQIGLNVIIFKLLLDVLPHPLDVGVDPGTSCVALESFGGVLLDAVSTLDVTDSHVLE